MKSVDGTHVPKVRDPAINQYESFDAISRTSMIHHGGLAGLCRRWGRKRKRMEYIKGDNKAVRDIDVGEDGDDEKDNKEYSRKLKQAKVEIDESKSEDEDATYDSNIRAKTEI